MKVKDLITVFSKEDPDLDILISVNSNGKEFVCDIRSLSIERIKVPYRKDFKASQFPD